MMNRSHAIATPVTACAVLSMSLLVGCGGEEPVAQAPPPPPPPMPKAPAKPAVTPIADLMAQLGIDERVELAEADAPDNDEDRIAVLEFFDAFARGDDESLRPMMTLADQVELDNLIESGAWQTTVDEISKIRVQTGDSPYGQDCALAVYEVGHDFQPQMWYFSQESDGPVFEAVMTPPRMIERLAGSDWIAAWHEVLEEEAALAMQPDDDHTVVQRNLDTGGGGGASGSGPQGPGSTPGAPGARPSGPITPTVTPPGAPLSPTGK